MRGERREPPSHEGGGTSARKFQFARGRTVGAGSSSARMPSIRDGGNDWLCKSGTVVPEDELDVIEVPSGSNEKEPRRSPGGRRLGVVLVLIVVLAAVSAYGVAKNNGGDSDSDAACNAGDLFEPESANAVVLLLLLPGTRSQSVDGALQPSRFRVAEMMTRAAVGGA